MWKKYISKIKIKTNRFYFIFFDRQYIVIKQKKSVSYNPNVF